MWMQLAGIGLSMLSSYEKNKQTADNIKAINKAKEQQFNYNESIVADMISTLDNRTSRAESEAVRQSLRTKINIDKARIKAEGSAAVQAAKIGGGSGTRASLSLFAPAERKAGNMVSDANINLQTELTNITEHFNDTANKAIANLNNSRPVFENTQSTASMLIDAAGAGLNYYSGLSSASKAEVGSLFKTDIGIKPVAFNGGGFGR